MIQATKNDKYIKSCVEDANNNLRHAEKIRLIYYLRDKDYVKKCLKNPSLKLTSYDTLVILTSTNASDCMKEAVEDEKIQMTIEDRTSLAINVSFEYAQECLKEGKYEIDSKQTDRVINLERNVDLMKECVKRKVINTDDLKLIVESDRKNTKNPWDMEYSKYSDGDLIVAIGEIDYMKKCLEDGKLETSDREAIENAIKEIETSKAENKEKTPSGVNFIKKCAEKFRIGKEEVEKLANRISHKKYDKEDDKKDR